MCMDDTTRTMWERTPNAQMVMMHRMSLVSNGIYASVYVCKETQVHDDRTSFEVSTYQGATVMCAWTD